MSLLAATWTLAAKDLLLYRRDRTGMMLGFLLPLGLVAVFGFMMTRSGGDSGMGSVHVAVTDLDDSEASAALVEALVDSDNLVVTRPSEGRWTRDQVVERVADGDEPLGLVIPAGYGEGAELELIADPGRDLEQQLFAISLMQALFESQGEDAGWAMTRRALLKAGLPEVWADRVQAVTQAFRISIEGLFTEADEQGLLEEDELVGGPADEQGVDMGNFMQEMLPVQRTEVAPEGRQQQITYMVSHAVSGMTVMMLLFSLVGCSRSLIIERDKGALKRLIASPIDPRAILLSKFVGTFLIGMLLIAFLFSFAALVFDLDVLSRLDTLLVLSGTTALAATAFAMAIAAWAHTDKQADGISTLLILLMSAIGGAWMPLMFMPEAVQRAARFTLTYWSLQGFQGTFWYGQHWTHPDMLVFIGVQLLIAAGLTVLAVRLFRSRYLAG
jgi:ABC-2 type transport system permease protein